MSPEAFSSQVAESLLVKCHRRCCLCHKYCGSKMEIHHIEPEEGNSEDNGIPLCFDCHAEVRGYDPKHPKGRKFTPSELKKHKEQWFKIAPAFVKEMTQTRSTPLDHDLKVAMFRESKRVLRKSIGLLKGHLTHLEEEGDEYSDKGRIPGEILNIVEHLSILSSIGNEDEKVKIDPLVKEGESYCEFSSTNQFLKNHSTISQWATRANSIQIDI